MIGGYIGKPIGGVIEDEGAALKTSEYNLPAAYFVPPLEANLKTWTWNYNLNLIGQDRFPSGRLVDWVLPTQQVRSANDLYSNTLLFMPAPAPTGKLMGQIWM